MIKVKTAIVPDDEHILFEDIISFVTENYVGLYDYDKNEFCLIPRADCQFEITYIGSPDNLNDLDDAVYSAIGEHIAKVSTSSAYTIALSDECEDN